MNFKFFITVIQNNISNNPQLCSVQLLKKCPLGFKSKLETV